MSSTPDPGSTAGAPSATDGRRSTPAPSGTDSKPAGATTIGGLISQLSEQVSALVRAEIALVKAEIAAKAKAAGIGIGLFVAAGVFCFFATGTLIAAAVLGLAVVWPAWLAALTVGVAGFAVAAVLVWLGVRLLRNGVPPTPERSVAQARDSIETIKGAL